MLSARDVDMKRSPTHDRWPPHQRKSQDITESRMTSKEQWRDQPIPLEDDVIREIATRGEVVVPTRRTTVM